MEDNTGFYLFVYSDCFPIISNEQIRMILYYLSIGQASLLPSVLQRAALISLFRKL
jgi:hypothetical protein